jgi:hypothetical protein
MKMKGINEKIARSNPDPRKVKKMLEKNVDYYTIRRAEGMQGRDDFTEHKFKNLEEANNYLQEQSLTAPDYGNGYHKTDVTIHYKNGKDEKLRLDMERNGNNTIDGLIYREELFDVENPYHNIKENSYYDNKRIYVRPHRKSDGTKVKGYFRRR